MLVRPLLARGKALIKDRLSSLPCIRAVNTREGLAITNVNKDVYINNNSQTLRFLVNYSLLRLEFFSLS